MRVKSKPLHFHLQCHPKRKRRRPVLSKTIRKDLGRNPSILIFVPLPTVNGRWAIKLQSGQVIAWDDWGVMAAYRKYWGGTPIDRKNSI